MQNLNELKCNNYSQFIEKLDIIEKSIQKKCDINTLKDISDFIDNNQIFFGNEKSTAIRLDSIAAKARKISADDPLISKIKNYTSQLLPVDKQQANDSLQFLRERGENQDEYIQSIADWINLMEIPLANLNLTETELQNLFPKLDCVDLRGFNYQSYDLEKLMPNLKNPNLKFITTDIIPLVEIAKLCAQRDGRGTALNIKNFGIKDEKAMIEIAKLCAQQSGEGTAQYIKNFEIKNEAAIIEIAKLCAQQNGGRTAEFIKNFGIKDEKAMIEIAKLCAQQNGGRTAEFIKNFGIKDEKAMIEIAKLCAKNNVEGTTQNIQNFGIKNDAANIEIAKLCAQQDVLDTAQNIVNFGIKDEAAIIEIAKFCAQQSGAKTARLIKNFGIKDEAARIEIAKLCVQQDCRGTVLNIKNFWIKNQAARIEIAKLCVQQDCRGTAEYIQNFGIKDETARIEIAKLCVQQNVVATVLNIKNFGIKNQAAIIEIAKLCAQQNGKYTAEFIKNFGIQNQAALVEIAKLCAQQNGEGTAQNIVYFGIKDEAAIIEIAKFCAQQSGAKTARLIKNFGIKNEAALIEIAKFCAQQSVAETVLNIKNFGIKNQAALVEIAKLCAQQNGAKTAEYIQNFVIKDETTRIEIAKLCAQQNLLGTGLNIKNFGIKNQAAIIEIAKLCAQQNGGRTAGYIQNFGIKDEAALIEIAKLCAQQNGERTAEYIQNFGIKNEAVLIEIAKLCAKQNGGGTARNIKNFGIKEPQIRLQLFFECIKTDPNTLFYIENFSPLPVEVGNLPALIAVLKSDAEENYRRDKLSKEIDTRIEKLPCSDKNKEKILDMSKKSKQLPTHTQNEATLWLLGSIFVIGKIEKEGADWMLGNGLWTELGLLRDPNLRSRLTSILFRLSPSEEDRKLWDKCLSSIRGAEGQKGLMLLAIPFLDLQRQGIDGGKLQQITNSLSDFQKDKKSSLRSVDNVKNLLQTCQLLSSTKLLSIKEKLLGIDKIFSEQNDEKETLNNVVAAKGLLQLEDSGWAASKQDLITLFRASFEKLIPLGDFKGDVTAEYENKFANSRSSSGLITYAAGLKTLKDQEVMACLGQFVCSVFDGTFKDKRYDTTKNPHLDAIFKNRPDLLEKWKKDFEVDLEKISTEGESEDVFDPTKWLTTKLIDDEHRKYDGVW